MVFVLAAFPTNGYAVESLRFGKITEHPDTLDQSGDVARIDLNGDGYQEYVFRYAKEADGYAFYVFGKANTFVPLGEYSGKKLMVSDDEHHGVRNLLVFNDPYNDFKFQTFAWDASKAAYALEGAP